MRTLNVFWGDQRVGRIWQNPLSHFCFRYDRDYLTSDQAKAISLSLPLQVETFEPPMAEVFFENLLPEGIIKDHIAKARHCSPDNNLALLNLLGGDCAGALTISAAKNPFYPENDPEPLSDNALEKLIINGSHSLLLAARHSRLTLAGAQPKIPLIIKDDQILLPTEKHPSSHIFKPDSDRFPDLVENEHFCMTLAKTVGLNVPKTHIWKGQTQKGLFIERYDRLIDRNGKIIRLHQEDFCQALGIKAHLKYEDNGGPSFSWCYRLLYENSANLLIDMQQFVDWVIFNYLIGNTDAHGKNISLLYSKDKIRLAPFYDLVSTTVYGDLSRNTAMRIGGLNRLDLLQLRHWNQLAETLMIKPRYVIECVHSMTEKVLGAVTEMPSETTSPVIQKLKAQLIERAEKNPNMGRRKHEPRKV